MTKILFLTVGTGNSQDKEKSLFNPIRKSMQSDEFDYFVLLPSTITEDNALVIKNEFAGKVFVNPLPEHIEDNADKCFEHFNKIIKLYMDEYKCQVEDIFIDITRGTKVMSAALYSAGLRHGIHQYRYISGPRDERGQVLSDCENIHIFDASMGIFLAKIDQAKSFLKSYNFGAVEVLFENEKSVPEYYRRACRYIVQAVQFYSAWHRLDYKKAKELCPDWGISTPVKELTELGLDYLIVYENMKTWIDKLSQDWTKLRPLACDNDTPSQEECIQKAEQAKYIAIDLLANGRRQIDMGNYEDAVVRMYRIVEMLGQIYLFQKGYDSANINPEDEVIKKFVSQTNNNLIVKNGIYSFHRSNVAAFIKTYFNRNLGENLFDIMDSKKEKCIVGFEERNNSILIHGFSVKNQKDAFKLKENFDRTEQVLKDVLSISQSDLLTAHKINSFRN